MLPDQEAKAMLLDRCQRKVGDRPLGVAAVKVSASRVPAAAAVHIRFLTVVEVVRLPHE